MEAATAIQSRLIGAILVEKNLITSEQLERALQVQEETGERLGEVVVAQFGVPRLELASVLAEQWAELEKAEREAAKVVERPAAAVEPLTPAEVQIRRPLGEIFVELGFISGAQLEAALDTQRESGARIGEILVEQGSLSRLDLASALAEQWSALQKLRPPAPVADPQPWQNGSPATSAPTGPEASADDHSALDAFDERLREVERAASAAPWQEDLRLVTSDLRAAIRAVEDRLETGAAGAAEAEIEAVLGVVNSRIEALEGASVHAELAVLRQELGELRSRPVTDEGLTDLRAAIERLEGRPDRAEEISQLSAEIGTLAARLDGLAAVGELANKLDAVAGQAEVAQTGIAGLSRRVDDLSGLERRLDELASRLPGDDVIDELRRALTDLATQAGADDRSDQGADIASLVARLDQMGARVEDVAATRDPDLTPRIDDLSARVDEITAAIPAVETDGLATRIASLEEEGRVGSSALERLAAELDALESSTKARLDGIAAREPDMSPVVELRARVDDLAATIEREPGSAPLEELRGRLDELAVAVERGADAGALDGLRFRLDELAEMVRRGQDAAPVVELRARVDDLAATIEREPGSAPLEELRGRLDELAAALASAPDPASVAELHGRVDELAALVESRQDTTALDGVRFGLDELAAVVGRKPDGAALDEIRVQLNELAEARERDASFAMLEARVAELEQGLAAATPVTELREEMRRVVESTVVERESLAQALYARVEEITATVPREDELTELRSQLEALAARPTEDRGLQARVDEMAARLEGLGAAEGAIVDLRESLAQVDGARVGDAFETGARLLKLETAIDSIAGLEARIREGDDLADRSRLLAARLDGTESRLVAVEVLEDSVSALAAELERRPNDAALAALAAELRAEIAVIADRPTIDDPTERLHELSRRIDEVGRAGNDRIGGVTEDLSRRIGGLAEEVRRRVEEIAGQAAGLVSRDEAAVTTAEQADWVRAELDALRRSAEEQADAVDASLATVERARAEGIRELQHTVGDAVGAVRSELDARDAALDARVADQIGGIRAELGEREAGITQRLDGVVAATRADLQEQGERLGHQLQTQWGETATLRARVDELQGAAADRTAWETRLEAMLEQRLEGLALRITDEVEGARLAAEEATVAVRGELGSLGARIDEMFTLRRSDVQAARAAGERLAESVEALEGLRADDAEAARGAAEDLSVRLEGLAASLQAESVSAHAASDRLTAQVAAQIAELHGLRTDDLAAVELAGAELGARLDDHAQRSAVAAFEVEQALREEIGGVAARLEERDVEGIEAREELRGELERVASSVGWRLERIEESLASEDLTALKIAVSELERRLEGQFAMGEEQVRATERALRKGLASLGGRLVDTESAYLEAGNALRRSIERLGAAVIEADARMADQIPVAEAEGCVAFAPTPAGYRLLELPGSPPELGSTVELEECDGPLVVTRYGRSPLPLDSRPCAYLDRA